MQTLHPTLLVGPYDWEPEVFPKSEFAERAAAFWAKADPSWSAVLVFGSPYENAELVYLTHFTPKLEAALALIPRDGAPMLLPYDPPSMWSAARRLTWIENFAPLKKASEALATWHKDHPGTIAGIHCDALTPGLHKTVLTALDAKTLPDATVLLHAVMADKRPREMQALKDAAGILDKASTALADAQRRNINAAAAIVAAEDAARAAGAQDIRLLYSRDGGRTLAPFTTLSDDSADPMVAYLAVRYRGYWADGFVTLASRPNEGARRVAEALSAMIKAAQPNVPVRDLAKIPASHPMIGDAIVSRVGLTLEEGPKIYADGAECLTGNAVYSLKTGFSDSEGHGLGSALVAIEDGRRTVLWRSP